MFNTIFNIQNLYICDNKPKVKKELTLKFTFDNQTQLIGKIMAISLVPNQAVVVELPTVDRKGNPAKVESIVFTSSDEAVFTVVQDAENPLKATITSIAVGVAQLDYKADADLTVGEDRFIEGFTAIEVQPEEAVGFGAIIVGTPTDL